MFFRKKLRTYLGNQFPQLTAEDLNALVSNKDEMQQSKLYTHSGESVVVYIKDGNPVFFEMENEVFPTVYTLWSFPDLMASFTTWPPVFEKLSGGADLMLPGLILKDDCSIEDKLANLRVGQICSIRLLGNKSPVGIGKSLISSQELFGAERKGKALFVLHTYGDHLWGSGDKSTVPIIEEAISVPKQIDHFDETEVSVADNLDNLKIKDTNVQDEHQNSVQNDIVPTKSPEEGNDGDDARSPIEIMDELLLNCILTAIKTSLKKVELPLLVSTLHKSHLLPSCPANQQVDVKKSSYKKISVFLKEIQKMGLLEVKELQKGVESIVSINFNHERLEGFKVVKSALAAAKQDEVKPAKEEYSPPQIQEMYSVSATVLPIFATEGIP